MKPLPTHHSPEPGTPVPACDVLVIGGGPGGSTAAALLARQGRRVVLVEKAHHPRFHIGESLLPFNAALFEQLGVRAAIERIGMPKWGVEFISPQHENPTSLEFAEAWNKAAPMAWQVRRSEMDELLFRHAAQAGAQTVEGCQVRHVQFDDAGATVHATLDDGTLASWRAGYVIDASGRDALLAGQFQDKAKHPRHTSAALFAHFRGAQRLEGEKREGNISIFWFEFGWFWFIPLADGTTSVGATVSPSYLKQRQGTLKSFFWDTVALVPALQARLKNAELVDDQVWATGNYSYTTAAACGPRWLRVGDAFAFIDPVFSSGVYLAMANAFAAVDVVAAALDEPRRLAAAQRRYTAHVRRGPQAFSWFIVRMNNPAMRHLFMAPRNVLRAREAVMAVLAGDVYGQSPIGPSLTFFKLVYWVTAAGRWRETLAAWRRRRRALADRGVAVGENVQTSSS